MKASNPKVMIEAYRLLVARLAAAGADWNYPIHLGVTEAGDGEDGRIKSAIGIGSLMSDGIGDTIRVSLTEDAVHEIPVAFALAEVVTEAAAGSGGADRLASAPPLSYDPFDYARRPSEAMEVAGIKLGGENTVAVFTSRSKYERLAHKIDSLGDFKPEVVVEDSGVIEVDPRDASAIARINRLTPVALVTVADGIDLPVIAAFRLLAARLDARHPILLKDALAISDDPRRPFLGTLLRASMNLGSLICDGIGDAILIQGEEAPGQSLRLAYNILQAAGARIFKTDYVACPSCGRTLFNLQETTAGSVRPPGISRASASPSWAASSTVRARWPTPTSATSAARQPRSTSTSARGGEVQYPARRGGRPTDRPDPRARQMGRCSGRSDWLNSGHILLNNHFCHTRVIASQGVEARLVD